MLWIPPESWVCDHANVGRMYNTLGAAGRAEFNTSSAWGAPSRVIGLARKRTSTWLLLGMVLAGVRATVPAVSSSTQSMSST